MSLVGRRRNEGGYTVFETMVVAATLSFVIAAAFNILQVSRVMDKQAEDGFQAQDEGRQVLTSLAKHMRPAENMNVPGVTVLYANNQGTMLDVKVDTNNDSSTDIVRFDLDRTNKQIKMYIDRKDTSGPDIGKFNYQKASHTYLQHYRVPANASDWDVVDVMANKIVNAPPEGSSTTPWSAQRATTDPSQDYRLFTFYGESFSIPLDTVGLGSVWMNYVGGVKIFLLSDIQPAEIPSPFAVETNVNFRNLSGN